MKTRLITLLLIVVSLLDVFFTVKLLHEGYKLNIDAYSHYSDIEDVDTVFEANPIAKSVIIKYGVEGMVVYKISIIIILCIVIFITSKKYPRLMFWITFSGFVLTALIAAYGCFGLIYYYFG